MADTFLFRLPREIYFGSGQGKRVGELVQRFGGKALVVTGKHFTKKYGILDEVLDSLRSASVEAIVFDQVEPEPSLATVDRGLRLSYEENCIMVISLGGGSVLDCGKAIAGVWGNGESVVPYFTSESQVSRPGLPWIAMPTTAGTGSEMTNNAVLTDYEHNLKKSVRSPLFIATMAIIDPLYTHFMDRYLTAVSGIDALVQAIEAYTSPRANPMTDFLALEATETLWRYLPLAVEEGSNPEYRKQMALGSMVSAMAFANTSSGPVHGLAHMVGPDFHIVHGESCGLLFPPVARFNAQILRERYIRLAQVTGYDTVEGWIEAFEQLLRRIGLRTRLRDFGRRKEELQAVVREERIGPNIRENPRAMGKKELIMLLEEVW